MVTIHDLTPDDSLLLDLFWSLRSRDRGVLIRRAAVLAWVESRAASTCQGERGDQSPEGVALAALWKCRPPLPAGWASDSDFAFEVEQAVCSKLRTCAMDMVLTTSDNDAANAAALAAWASEHAARIGPDYCAPAFEDGYVSATSMLTFIEDWRDAFVRALHERQVSPTLPESN